MRIKNSLDTNASKNTNHKCNEETGCCDALLNRLEFNGHRGKGFSRVLVITREDFSKATCEPKVVGIKYTVGAKDRGMMLNYCPFCGAKLDWSRKNANKKSNSEVQE